MQALNSSSASWKLAFASSAIVVVVAALTTTWCKKAKKQRKSLQSSMRSVNYHFLRECNYGCNFCFHTDLKSEWVGLENALEAIRLLKQAGCEKLNFSGGEPFLKPKDLGKMVKFAKKIGVKSVSIISNGSLIKEDWLDENGSDLDILGISCDSFKDSTNQAHGRYKKGRGEAKDNAFKVAEWCAQRGIMFKLNTVVTSLNCNEDMKEGLRQLRAIGLQRWKVFQCLAIEGENIGDNKTSRDVSDLGGNLLITDAQFRAFLDLHAEFNPVFESNELMRNSYVMLDEKCRFLNNQGGCKTPTKSILEVGVAAAFMEAGFEQETFIKRGGLYAWSRSGADIEDVAPP